MILARFLIALLLGAQVGLVAFLTPAPGRLYLGPVPVLLVAVLLSLIFDPQVRQGRASRQRFVTALWRVSLVIVAPVLTLAVLGTLLPSVWFPAVLVFFWERACLSLLPSGEEPVGKPSVLH